MRARAFRLSASNLWRVTVVAVGLVICPSLGFGLAVRLLDEVAVKNDEIHLSDLMPNDAPQELRARTAQITLGRAPQGGSARLIPGLEVGRRIQRSACCREEFVIPDAIHITRACLAVNQDAVRENIRGFLEQQGWIDPSFPLTQAIAWPRELCGEDEYLRPVKVDPDPRQQVLLLTLKPAGRDEGVSVLATIAVSENLIQEHSRMAPPSGHAASERARVQKQMPSLAVKSGEKAALFVDQGPIHLSIPVICLQAGRTQQIISVRRVGMNKILRAKVAGAHTLQVLSRAEEN